MTDGPHRDWPQRYDGKPFRRRLWSLRINMKHFFAKPVFTWRSRRESSDPMAYVEKVRRAFPNQDRGSDQ